MTGMTRALTAVGGLLAVALLVLGLAVYLTRTEDRVAVDNLLAEDLTRAVATAEDRDADIDLGSLADFEWDELLLVERKTSREDISRELGYEWKGDLGFQTGDLLIFLHADGEVARFADYRGEGRFAGVARPIARLDRDAAVFRVRALVIRPRAG